MRVLFLQSDSPQCEKLKEFLLAEGEEVVGISEKITPEEIKKAEPDIAVSYNYRHILKPDVFLLPRLGTVNLHISYLPWNKGVDPNFWSHIEGTPAGVTIHHIDEGVDTGDIIAQERVAFSPDDTLETSYEKLHFAIQDLFKRFWPLIRAGKALRIKQEGAGTFHKKKDKEAFLYLLEEMGFKTPIAKLAALKLDHSKHV